MRKVYWTKERCKEVSLLCEYRNEFYKKYKTAYVTSSKNRWLDEICSHMEYDKRKDYWTKERCKEVALLCEYRNEFNKKYKSAYVTSSKKGWLQEICSHMEYDDVTPPNFWTKEKCKEVVSKFKCRSDFQKSNYNVYRIAYNKKWLDEICSHMIKIGNIYKRLVYIYEFTDNSIYVGLTCNSIRRLSEHLNINSKTSVYKHIKETGLSPTYTELSDYIDSVEASELEKYYVNYYREKGFNILNRNDAGGLGGGKIKWTYENCKKISVEYKNRHEFKIKLGRAYEMCRKNCWLDEFFPNKNQKTLHNL